MSQLSKIPPSQLEKLSPEKHKGIVLNELKREDVIAHIAGLLHDVARLYQIPNWGATESVHLAGWILRTYKYEELGAVCGAIENYKSSDRMWRLTPDTVGEAMAQELERRAEKREVEWHNTKHEYPQGDGKEISEKTQKMISLFLKKLERNKDIPSITDPLGTWRASVIKRFAQEYGVTYMEMSNLYDKWYKSGTMFSFEEWLLAPEDDEQILTQK